MFADNKHLIVPQMVEFFFQRIENIVELPALSAFPQNMLTHSHTMTPFDAPGKQAF